MDTKREKKLAYNSISALAYQFITIVCSFVVPKLILTYLGSEVNGLVSSINQFLNLITFLDLGVGTVVTTAFYKPLASRDDEEISRIYVSAKRFFTKIALIFLVYIAILLPVYPTYIASQFNSLYTVTLIIAISITLFAQYYFGIVNQLLLNADQRSYIIILVQAVTLIINTVACAILMKCGASIQIVKFSTSLIFLARPLALYLYVRKHYNINKKIRFSGEAIKQKWNGLAQHIAFIVTNNTDTIVLSILSTLSNVSIYGVYNLIVTGLKTVCNSLTTGVAALLGNMMANNEMKLLGETFEYMEWLIHTCVIILFTMCGILIVPFVRVYTMGITDTDYVVPAFAALITLAQGSYCLRIPYNTMVLSAGHYKQTQTSSIVEMLLNIIISVSLVIKFGLIGVAIGTLVSIVYRTVFLAWYLSKDILCRRLIYFWKHILIDFITLFFMLISTRWITIGTLSYISWVIMAFQVGLICVPISIVINLIFYKGMVCRTLNRFIKLKS